MADGHAALTPGLGLNADTDPAYTNSETVSVQRTRASIYGAGGAPGNGLVVNADGSITTEGVQISHAVSATPAQCNAGTFLWSTQLEPGAQRRAFTVNNTGDQPVDVFFYTFLGGAGGAHVVGAVLQVTVANGTLVTCWQGGNNGGTIVAGNTTALAIPAYSTSLFILKHGSNLTTGGVTVDYTAST